MPNITLNDANAVCRVPRAAAPPRPQRALPGGQHTPLPPCEPGLGCDWPPRGLMVPTLFNADEKSLREISSEAKALIAACQEGSINPDLLQGGSFTVSNLGSLGIEHFTPGGNNLSQTGIPGVAWHNGARKDGQGRRHERLPRNGSFAHIRPQSAGTRLPAVPGRSLRRLLRALPRC